MRTKFLVGTIAVLVSYFMLTPAKAQWKFSPDVGTKFAASSLNEYISAAKPVTDGAGGAIVVFRKGDTNGEPIHAQRISVQGEVLWGDITTPKPVCTLTSDKFIEHAIADGKGGIYISWGDIRRSVSGDIYIQHLDSNGNALWQVNGIKVNGNSSRDIYGSKMCASEANGVIITWHENSYANNRFTYGKVFAQKYNSLGMAQWAANGVAVCTDTAVHVNPDIVSDGAGGAMIAFTDNRNSSIDMYGAYNNLDIYAQRISSTGSLLWTNNGAAVSTEPMNQEFYQRFRGERSVVADGSGGMIALFRNSFQSYFSHSFVAQRINASGIKQWPNAGVIVANQNDDIHFVNMASDGAGGLVASWINDHYYNPILYAQRILSDGNTGWVNNGVRVVQEPFLFFNYPEMCEDGNGAYIFTWDSYRYSSWIVKAQKIDNGGIPQWGYDGRDINTNPTPIQEYPLYQNPNPRVVKSRGDSAIFFWHDQRNFAISKTDIYAAMADGNGSLVNSNAFITNGNGNWNNPAIWKDGIVPLIGSDVIVKHHITVTANSSCNSLKIEQPNGKVTVAAGVDLKVLH
jgi:hypothetical protein